MLVLYMYAACIAFLVVQSLAWLLFEPLADNRSQLGENLPGFCDTLPVHDDDLGQDTGCTNLSVEAQENIKTKNPQLLTPTKLDDTLRSKHL